MLRVLLLLQLLLAPAGNKRGVLDVRVAAPRCRQYVPPRGSIAQAPRTSHHR